MQCIFKTKMRNYKNIFRKLSRVIWEIRRHTSQEAVKNAWTILLKGQNRHR